MAILYQNKWAFIVGGSTGIGFALAKVFLSKGSKVIIIARNEKRLQSAAEHLKQSYPHGTIDFLSVDASDENALKSHFQSLADKNIAPYFLVNCAGRAIPDYFENISTQQLKDSFQLNVVTAWNSIQAALPFMKKAGGYIVNTSSIAGFLGVYGYSDYSVTKFGLIGLSEVLRSELEPMNIRVAVLCPPDTETPGFEEENKTKPEETKAISGNAKLLSADEVARATLKELEKGKFILLADFTSRLTYLLKRWLPDTLYKIIQKDVRKVQKQKSRTN